MGRYNIEQTLKQQRNLVFVQTTFIRAVVEYESYNRCTGKYCCKILRYFIFYKKWGLGGGAECMEDQLHHIYSVKFTIT